MKKIKKYEVIIDDGRSVFKTHIPAFSVSEIKREWDGNGEFIRIKEVPYILPDANRVGSDLRSLGYGDAEIEIITRILQNFVEGTE